jgi:hypothetical protein
MPNFTKGNWYVEVLQNDTHVESEHETICTNCSNENASLISASPIGYELAEAVLNNSGSVKIKEIAQRFIAKANWR